MSMVSYYERQQVESRREGERYANIFDSFNAAMDTAALAVRQFSRTMEVKSKRIAWDLRIMFCDDPKQRRRLIRDMAREYRRPALIHNGGKP